MKIFVAKLGFYTKADDLVALFSKFGKVDSAKVIMDRDTNRSKCYGFVEMPNDAEAYAAIVELDDCIFQGSTIDVKKIKIRTSHLHNITPYYLIYKQINILKKNIIFLYLFK